MPDEQPTPIALTSLEPICPTCYAQLRRPPFRDPDGLRVDHTELQAVGCPICGWIGRALFAVETRVG